MSWSAFGVIEKTFLGGGGWIRFIAKKKKTSEMHEKPKIDSSVIINKQMARII